MMAGKKTKAAPSKDSKLVVEDYNHEDRRVNIPTGEQESLVEDHQRSPIEVAFERRNKDLDPQLVWRGKDMTDWSDLVVHAPPLYIQEKIHPKVLIDDLKKQTDQAKRSKEPTQYDLFSDFNGIPEGADKTDFYKHDQNWTNRMILGDSLQVMASLAEREGLKGKVQCIYIDPPYGIKFNSNFQWSTTSRDVKDGNKEHITREPEQVKAFRDTWRDGIHSYLTYLRDRLTVARELLTESGSIFVQIGDENVHRVRALMEEVFGETNFVSQITLKKSSGLGGNLLPNVCDYALWFAKDINALKFRTIFDLKGVGVDSVGRYDMLQLQDGTTRRITSEEQTGIQLLPEGSEPFSLSDPTAQGFRPNTTVPYTFQGTVYLPGSNRCWRSTVDGLDRVTKAFRFIRSGKSISFLRKLSDYPVFPMNNVWADVGGIMSRNDPKVYVVQTSTTIIGRCILMTTDPGDLVLDPTCGSGTTAYVAEQWGRRWITIDTSRVALALARARITGAKYPYYLLADSHDGLEKEAEITRTQKSSKKVTENIRQGFVYERVPHITLKSIAKNSEIDVIWENWQAKLEPIRQKLNSEIKKKFEEWEIPREADSKWNAEAKKLHETWWRYRVSRQQEIDKSIGAKAEFEYLYDKPYVDKGKVRVAGPFTVESISPHRQLDVDENDDLIDPLARKSEPSKNGLSFAQVMLENLKTAGVQQPDKKDKITFSSLEPWPGSYVCADGRYNDAASGAEKRAAIFIGPEFGTVSRADLVEAAREASEAGFDVLIACAFNFDAHSTEFSKLGKVPVLKARMNADLHMADDLKNTGKGNLFVVFGEPDIVITKDKNFDIQVEVKGVDVFDPKNGEVRSDSTDNIACWFVDTDYNGESFFVRHAYFLGANDPYKSLKTTLKAEINAEAWESLNSAISRPFAKPKSGRIAVKVINHLGDEVMKVFKVD